MRVGLFLKYDREIGKWSENREIPDLWGRVDRYGSDVIMTFLQITSLMSYGSMIQCQKIYILCFISTKYISFVTEYIVSMAVFLAMLI